MSTTNPLREVTEDGKLNLRFHNGQMRTWNSIARFVFMLAGSQGGKTSFLPHWLHRECETARGQLAAGEPLGDFLAVTSTYDQFKLKMLPEMLAVFIEILGIGRYWAGSRVLELREGLVPTGSLWASKADDPMWGRIILRSAEAVSGLEAATAKAAALDEVGQPEFTRGAWDAILRRVALHKGRVLGVTTIYNAGWLKSEVYDRWAKGDKNYEVVQFDSVLNPMFPQEEFERARETMPTWKFNMFYRGRYDQPAGLVYKNFDSASCVIDRFPIPDNWLWYVGHDFGGRNPAVIAFAQDPGTRLLYAAYEYMPDEVGVYDQVQHLKEEFKGRIVLKRQGGSHQEVGWRDDYTAKGWPIAEPPVNDVGVGISRVWAFHQRNSIMVFRDMARYIDEKTSYSYKMGDGDTVLDEIEDKSRYHIMDSERYALCGFYADMPTSDREVIHVRRRP
jgi:hypothetical protein